jgi:hypothetical protein
VYLSMYNQKPPESTEFIDALTLVTELLDNDMPLNIPNKTKINWFVKGLEQGLAHFKQDAQNLMEQ